MYLVVISVSNKALSISCIVDKNTRLYMSLICCAFGQNQVTLTMYCTELARNRITKTGICMCAVRLHVLKVYYYCILYLATYAIVMHVRTRSVVSVVSCAA